MLFFRKNIMACTGLFLSVFLLVHLLGNLILLLPSSSAAPLYNLYSHTLAGNLFIKCVSILLYLSIIFHTVYAVLITLKNKSSRGEVDYYFNKKSENSSWTSTNMGVLGFIILFFIVVHMANFWVRLKLGFGDAVPLDAHGHKDVYLLVSELFKNPLYVAFYSLVTIPLALHVKHGFSSAIKTLGVYKKSYIKKVDLVATVFSLAIFVGFVIIPVVVYFRGVE
jgi:succinate dehydrogenase / fumarate reductase, cytochrome b subunit